VTQAAIKKVCTSNTGGAAPPHSFTTHGITVVDDYAWLKDADWQEVLRDPSILDADIANISKRKTTTSKACSATPPACKRRWSRKCAGRIKEDDSSVPAPDVPTRNLRKFRDGGEHECMAARHATAANRDRARWRQARGPTMNISSSAAAGISGSQARGLEARISRIGIFHARVRNWADGADHADIVEETDGAVVWNAASTASIM